MIGIIKHMARGLYFLIGRLLFVLLKNTPAPGLKIYIKSLSSVRLSSNNKIGDNCKIIIPTPKGATFAMGERSWLRDRVEINLPPLTKVQLANDVSIQDNCKLIGDISIGAGTIVAPDVFIASGSHYPFSHPELTIREQDELNLKDGFKSQPVHICEDCWIGKGAVISPGITIGKGAIIGSYARISKDVAPFSVVVGNNQEIKKRIDFLPPSEILPNKASLPYLYEGCYTKNFTTQRKITFRSEATVVLCESNKYSAIKLDIKSTNNGKVDVYINDNLLLKNYHSQTGKTIPFSNFDEIDTPLPVHHKHISNYTVVRLTTKSPLPITIQNIALV